jgi:tetratricopeptide (TPR) repeat protein
MSQMDRITDEIAKAAKRRDPRDPVRRLLVADEGASPAPFFSRVTAALQAAGRSVLPIELPSGRFDAGEHLLGQLCQGLDAVRLPRASFSPNHPIHKRIAWIARDFGPLEAAPVLLLSVPGAWLRRGWDASRSLPDTAQTILEALLRRTGFDALVVTTRQLGWLERLAGGFVAPLPVVAPSEGFLLDRDRWKTASAAARELASVMGEKATAVPPHVLEIGVACRVLGGPSAQIASVLSTEEAERKLVEMTRKALPDEPEWGRFLRRLALPRFPVPRALLENLAGPMSPMQQAFADALVHEERGQAKAHDVIHRLLDARAPDPEANARLAEHFRTLDGAGDPETAIRARRVIAWLERVHHLGHAGRDGLAALRDIQPLSRMSRYELAWSLSYEFEEYALAAEIYRDLVEAKPDDAYSHHYWAWNLDQEGKEFATVRREYARAIAIEPENPWYNSRYITFLRDNGFQREARDAWRDALPIVSASTWAKMPDFAGQFHRWVARSALDAGDLVLAQEVLGTLPAFEVKHNPKLAPLLAELDYLLDIDRLGEPVYPLGVPADKRWKNPYLVPQELGASECGRRVRLLAFYPGRIAAIEGGQVTFVLVDPRQDPPALFTLELSERELGEIGPPEPPQVGRFVELGHYEDDVTRVRYHASRQELDRSSFDHSLRHLRNRAPREGR